MPPSPRKFTYAAEKLYAARRALMAPHGERGEAGAFAYAFGYISRLRDEDVSGLPEDASTYWQAITRLMDTTHVQDPQGRGTHVVLSEEMDEDDKAEFSRNVDELASWLSHYEHDRSK